MRNNYTRQFEPYGGAATTQNVVVTGTNQSATISAGTIASVVRLTNIGTQTVFVAFGSVAVAATSMPILANSSETFAVPQDKTTLQAIAATTGSTLYITQGTGS